MVGSVLGRRVIGALVVAAVVVLPTACSRDVGATTCQVTEQGSVGKPKSKDPGQTFQVGDTYRRFHECEPGDREI